MKSEEDRQGRLLVSQGNAHATMQTLPRKAVKVIKSWELAARARVEFLVAVGANDTALPKAHDDPRSPVKKDCGKHQSIGLTQETAYDYAVGKPTNRQQQIRALDIADVQECLHQRIKSRRGRVICKIGRHYTFESLETNADVIPEITPCKYGFGRHRPQSGLETRMKLLFQQKATRGTKDS